jgi:hypothetical protein
MSARIVVLDAEPVVRTAITEILKHGGYTVESSGSIHSAIQIIKNSRPDLLLTNGVVQRPLSGVAGPHDFRFAGCGRDPRMGGQGPFRHISETVCRTRAPRQSTRHAGTLGEPTNCYSAAALNTSRRFSDCCITSQAISSGGRLATEGARARSASTSAGAGCCLSETAVRTLIASLIASKLSCIVCG